MAVSSLRGCWSKLSARIRDYIDVVDSYYRPSDEVDGPTSGLNATSLSTTGGDKSQHRCGRKDCPMTSVVQLAASHHHHHHHHQSSNKDKRSCKHKQNPFTIDSRLQDSTIERLTSRSTNHQQQRKQNCLSLGYTKRKTPQGQVYFVDLYGHKFWHDPSVPKELLNASLDLDSLVGRLSNNWEIKQTSSGRTYFINHTKRTTQFTDPRLVVYKDQLMNYLRRSNACTDLPADPNSANVPSENTLQSTANNSRSPNAGSCNRTNRNRSHCLQPKLSNARQDLQAISPFNGDTNSSSRNSRARAQLDDTNLAGGTLDNRRSKQYQKNLLRGSHHDLNTTTTVPGQSNTFTGPVPSWLKPLVSNGSRKQTNVSAQRNDDALNYNSVVTHTTPAPQTNNIQIGSQNNNYYRQLITDLSSPTYSTNISQNPHNASNYDLSSPPSYNHNHHHHHNHNSYFYEHPSFDSTAYPSPYNEDNNRELFDKISILRQELLKQQVLSHPCRIDINRKRIFEESFRTISQMQPRDLKKRLLVKFRGEEGLDYGGVAREWFYLLSREILNPVHGLFQYTSDDIYNLQINPDSGIVYREHLSYMNFCGRVIGMAVFHGHFIEGRFTLPFYKMLLRKSITLDDIEFVDPDLHRSLCWILDNDITDVIDTTFLVQHNAFGQLQEHELKENGRNIVVTEANKHEYVSLYVNYRCRRGIESQFEALQRGFYELIAPILVSNFDERELELLIGGLSKINVEDWRLHTRLKNCTTETPLVVWFWDIVKSYDEEKRARLLQFVTGSPRVPIQGFKALQGVNSELRLFTIHLIRNASTDNLPKSHTCFNRIDLPPYESYEKLRDKLTQAIEETMGFAMQ